VIKVTFDSNVWEKLVSDSSKYPKIRKRILNGSISPYLCEISLSLESIPKLARQRFFPNYGPVVTFKGRSRPDGQIEGTLQIGPNNKLHPGLSPILLGNLLRAREMGFKVLTMTNFVTVRSLEIPEEMRATIEGWDGYWEYAERLSECSKFIETMGCGIHHYNATKNSKPEVSNKQYSAAVAEWVDGDALSAHYAFGCDVHERQGEQRR
jgi:hypothetical protein